MSIDPLHFRRVMRRFATGVTVVTVRDGGLIHGMTANAFTSVSLSPALVLVCILKGSATHDLVSHAGSFAVNILSEAQRGWAQRFARQVPVPADPFADIAYHTDVTGAPIFDDCMSYVDCKLVAAYDGGDHTIFMGEVLGAGLGTERDAEPLLWFEGKYAEMGKQ